MSIMALMINRGSHLAPHRAARQLVPTITAFKESSEPKEATKGLKTQRAEQQDVAPAPQQQTPPATAQRGQGRAVAPYGAFETMPFRRMMDSMTALQREMDAMMGSFGMLDTPLSSARSPFALLDAMANDMMAPISAPTRFNRMVPVEVEEDDTKYTVRLEAPGFSKENIKVTLDPNTNTLTMSGSTTASSDSPAGAGEGAEAGTYRSSMSFTRRFTLPPDVDVGKPMSAKAQHGIITLELPKLPAKAQPAPKEIPVE